MRNRAIFKKIQQSQAIKDMSLLQLQTLNDKSLKAAVLLSKEEQREYSRYSLGIKELLLKDFILARRQSELDATLNLLRTEFPDVQGILSGKNEIRLWLHGDMPKSIKDKD